MGKRKAEGRTAAELIPARPTLDRLRERAAGCQACDLWERGTQTVFGVGATKAALMLAVERRRFD